MKARKIINTGTLKNIGKFPSLKTGNLVWFESHLERDFIFLTEFDREVIRYNEQPFRVEYLLDGKKHKYFPDFLVERKDKKQVIEIKPQSKIEKEDFIYFSQVMRNHLARENYEYLVITDSIIRRQPKLSNVQLLWRYARYPIQMKHKILLHEVFGGSSQLLLKDVCSLLNQSKEQKELIYALIFHGYLKTDIDFSISANSILSIGKFN